MKSFGDDLPSNADAKKFQTTVMVLLCLNLVVGVVNLAITFCPTF